MEEHNLGQFGNLQLTNVRVRQRDGNTVKSALLTEVNAAALDFRSHPALNAPWEDIDTRMRSIVTERFLDE